MAAKKTGGLGKGLDALFGTVEITPQAEAPAPAPAKKTSGAKTTKKKTEDVPAEISDGDIAYIDINDIKPNADQPRKTFDEVKLAELADSIVEHGLIQPLVLRKAAHGYEIVAGERRWRAARIAGIKELPCIIRELTDEENMLLAIIENMQREDLNPIEEAQSLKAMIDTYKLTQEQVSKSVGKSRPYITNSLRLLKLADEVQEMLSEGELTSGHARALAAVKDEDKQIELAKKIVKNDLSVRQVEALMKEKPEKKTAKPKAKAKKDADEKRVEEELKEVLGTKVTLNRKGKKGKIEIDFYSKEELERLIDLLRALK